MAEYYNTKGERLESWFETHLDNERQALIDNKATIQLEEIKRIRLEKLQETDFWVMRGNITDAQTQYRQKLRDIPADYDSSKYDALLARDSEGQLTHTVWTKP